MKTLDQVRMAVLGLGLVLVAACGGGGGGSTPSPGPTELKLLFSNLADSVRAMPVATGTQWLFDFSPAITADAVEPFVELRSADETVPVTVDLVSTSLRIRPAQELRLRTDYTLTFKAGMKTADGATLRADIVRRFRTVLFDGVNRTVYPGNLALINYRGQHTFRIADVNGDGRLDIVQIGGQTGLSFNDFAINIIQQNADHSFTRTQNLLVSESQSMSGNEMGDMAVIDLDHDDVPEIVVGILRPPGLSSGLWVFKQNAAGEYAPAGLLETSITDKMLLTDLNHDGRQDLVVFGRGYAVNEGGNRCGMVAVLSSPVGAQVNSTTDLPCGRFDAVIGSLERAGQVDLVLLYKRSVPEQDLPVGQRLHFYTLDEVGRPMVNTSLTTAAAAVCAGFIDCSGLMLMDINGDKVPDLLFHSATIEELTWRTVVYVRDAAAGYQEYARQNFGVAHAMLPADVDRDGRDDLLTVVQYFGSGVGLGLSKASPGFEMSHLIPIDLFDTMNQATVAVADLDGDGLPDLVGDSYNSGLSVLFLRGR